MTKPIVFLVLVLSTLVWSAPNRPIDGANQLSENIADQDHEDIVDNGLEKLSTIANAPKKALQNAKKTFDDIQQFIKSTQESIESMFVQLFKAEEMGANISRDLLLEVNEVKNELRECRQEFRRLAVTTGKSEVKEIFNYSIYIFFERVIFCFVLIIVLHFWIII